MIDVKMIYRHSGSVKAKQAGTSTEEEVQEYGAPMGDSDMQSISVSRVSSMWAEVEAVRDAREAEAREAEMNV